eukprot:RCo047664
MAVTLWPLRAWDVVRATHRRGFSTAGQPALEVFEEIVGRRRAARRFADTPVPLELVQRLLVAAQRAPTGFNLQGWVAVVVDDPKQRDKLWTAAVNQPHVRAAPVVVVFAGNTRPQENLSRVLQQGLTTGHLTPVQAQALPQKVAAFLEGGPCGAFQYLKHGVARLSAAASVSVPLSLQGYAWKQTMAPAMVFLLAAYAAGLACCPIEGFDEEAVKTALSLPSHYTVPVIVPLGFAHPEDEASPPPRSPRLPFEEVVFHNTTGTKFPGSIL